MTQLWKEINEQPDAIKRFLTEERDAVEQAAQAIRDFDPAFVMIAARGTSDNAARYVQYLLSIEAGLPVALATPSVHTLYGAQPRLSNALVIGISQSGKSTDVLQIVQDAQQQNALTISVTNDPASPMAQAADHHLWLRCGEEKSVAATKTYTTQLTALALLTHVLTQNTEKLELMAELPGLVQQTLQQSEPIANWVQRYRYMEHVAVIGRGLNYSTAMEIALKIKELCYITGEEYSEADFRHGPIAIISPGFPVLAVAPTGKTLPVMLDLLKQLQERSAETVVISNDLEACSYGANSVTLPEDVVEWLSPVLAVIPGQLFAYHLATARGHNVDHPRGLNKVTLTR